MGKVKTASTDDAKRRAMIRACHAACRHLGLDTDARHDVQISVTGRASMRDMGPTDLARLLDHLNGRTGGGSQAGGARGRRWHAAAPRADLRLIHALWGELGRKGALARPDRAGLNAFIRARCGPHWSCIPLDVDALTDPRCITDVIRALRAMLARTGRDEPS